MISTQQNRAVRPTLLAVALFIAVLLGIVVSRTNALARFSPWPQHGKVPVPKRKPTFLFLSDVHLNTSSKTTAYGGDTGMELWAAFLGKVGSILGGTDAPDYIVYTGDLPAHYSCSESCYLPPSKRVQHNKDIARILHGLNDLAVKYHKPIFYLPGNNDALAGDYYSFADSQQKTPLSLLQPSSYFYPTKVGKRLGVPCMVSNPHPTVGYYSAYPIKGLRLIALNTVIYNHHFTAVDGTTQQADGNAQMAWLAGQLADAAAKKEKVYIAMHVPPGEDAYSGNKMWTELPGNKVNWNNAFLGLTSSYKATIAGILYGHTHMEEVRRLYDPTGKSVTEVAISCPGVTPQHNNNPGFKTVVYDETSKELMDYTTYYTVPSSTVWGDSTYTFSSAYGGNDGSSIFERLTAMPLTTLGNCMNTIFTVKNGPAGYNIAQGVEVKKQ